jgi:probable rRNA maturation factor
VPLKKVRLKAQAILNALGSPDGELSIVIADDAQIKELNRDYLNRDRPTNVIAFPMQEGPFSGISPHMLGDVVISVETALSESKSADMAFDCRFDQLLIHGILHLFGYDHEKDEEAAQMEEKCTALLELIENL